MVVKELYMGDNVLGWVVFIKVDVIFDSKSWYWYEVFNIDFKGKLVFEGLGNFICVGCYFGGSDYVFVLYLLK